MRVSTDGYIDLTDPRRVKTPGAYEQSIDPVPEAEALAFLLSHNFRGHRRVVRALSEEDRKRIRLALWADTISERLALVDRVWRSITVEVPAPKKATEPELVQVLQHERWAYPIYLDGEVTRVLPERGLPLSQLAKADTMDFDRRTA